MAARSGQVRVAACGKFPRLQVQTPRGPLEVEVSGWTDSQFVAYRIGFIPNRRFEYVSASASAVLGYAPEDFYADPGLDVKIVHPDDRCRLRALADTPVAMEPLRWVCRDGAVVRLEHSSMPLRDDDGSLVAIEGVVRPLPESNETNGDRSQDWPTVPSTNGGMIPQLSGREKEVLYLVMQGLRNAEIAETLVVSPRTVDGHMDRLLSKLQAPNRTAAAVAALRLGILDGWVAGNGGKRKSVDGTA